MDFGMVDWWIYAITFWLICGFLGAFIYRKKGKKEGSGFVLGFLLGPLGVIIALVSRPDSAELVQMERKIEEERLGSGELKKCPFCAELIKSEALVCKHCGRDLPAAEHNTVEPVADKQKEVSNKNEETILETNSQTNDPDDGKRKYFAWLVIILVFVVIALIYFANG